MARFKPYDFDQSAMLPLCLEDQLLPGTFEDATHHLIEERLDDQLFAGLYGNDHLGAPTYPPRVLLKEHKEANKKNDGDDDPDRPRKAADKLRKQASKIEKMAKNSATFSGSEKVA